MVHYVQKFDASVPVDMRHLTELALIAGATSGDYSDETANGFTITRQGVTIVIAGVNLTFAGSIPDTGTVTSITVKHGNATAYAIEFDFNGSVGTSVAEFKSIFDTTDTVVLAKDLFSGKDVNQGIGLLLNDDRIYGFDGSDLLSGGYGNDEVHGGKGADEASGGAGNDKLFGDSGADALSGDSGNDRIDGGSGNDTAVYRGKLTPVIASLDAGHASTARIGISEVDTLVRIENLTGGLGNDKLTGDSQDNILNGYVGADILSGKGGRDTLIGGWGQDTLTGGSGRDSFVFDTLPAVNSAGGVQINTDTITDFVHGVDKIHLLDGIFFPLAEGALSPANFLSAPHAISGGGGQYIIYDSSTGDLFYDDSGDGSGIVRQFAHLEGAPDITASDFLVVASA